MSATYPVFEFDKAEWDRCLTTHFRWWHGHPSGESMAASQLNGFAGHEGH